MKKIFIMLCWLYAETTCAMESTGFEQTKNMLSKGNLPARSITALKKTLPHMSLEQIEELKEITQTQLSKCSYDENERYQAIAASLKIGYFYKQSKIERSQE